MNEAVAVCQPPLHTLGGERLRACCDEFLAASRLIIRCR